MKRFLVPILLSFISSALFFPFLNFFNCYIQSLLLSYLISGGVLVVYLKRSDAHMGEATSILAMAIILLLTPLLIHLRMDVLSFTTPQKWLLIFTVQRFESAEILENSKLTGEFDFEKPECYLAMQSKKFDDAQLALFYYHTKKVDGFLSDYIKRLKSKGFEEVKLDLPLNKTYAELTLYNNITLENENMIVHCEVLVRERSGNAVILVITADKKEINLLRKLVR
jgi:hypothetical protein